VPNGLIFLRRVYKYWEKMCRNKIKSTLYQAGMYPLLFLYNDYKNKVKTEAYLIYSSGYIDFLNLLTTRDNSRQSIADILVFRLALNGINDTTGLVDLNISDVHFMEQSLGSIYGTVAVAIAIAIANKSLPCDLAAFDSMYAFKTAVINVPTGGPAAGIFDAANSGPSIKGTLLVATSTEFVQFLAVFAVENGLPTDVAIGPAYTAFEQLLGDAELAEISTGFSSFKFASQTAIDASDSISSASELANTTPVLIQLVVGG
jgi:hypothetical protein